MDSDKFADKFKIKSTRLKNWNYSTNGFYFITIKTLNNNNFFGKIIDNKIILSTIGIITNNYLLEIPKHFKNIFIDEFIIMPNHVHILFHVKTPDLNLVETRHGASLHKNQISPIIIPSHKNHPDFFIKLNTKSNQEIPKIINQFKSSVKRECNKNKLYFAWQSRYHDHIIHNQEELLKVKNYIINNPINWQKDDLNKN